MSDPAQPSGSPEPTEAMVEAARQVIRAAAGTVTDQKLMNALVELGTAEAAFRASGDRWYPGPGTDLNEAGAEAREADSLRASGEAGPDQTEQRFTEDDIAHALDEALAEKDREARTDVWLSFWDRLKLGDPGPERESGGVVG